ncbi:caspase family protein [Plantibacter sp. LMC-P-059a]|uniref:caspase family protein n=1 Tax=Plantibacter sp. LMC-P-059a TaxID=3040297 RepID=UPI00254F0A87|nr:caspase family protein [Plantibacter sp. LMC-P-059a]
MGLEVAVAFKKLGLETIRIDDATGEQTRNALEDALRGISHEETTALVVYLAGHGEFTGADVRILSAHGSDISLTGLLDCVDRAAVAIEEIVVFLDACNSGDGAAIARTVHEFWINASRNRRLVLIPSALPGGTAYEGVFSKALATALNTLTRPNKESLTIHPAQLMRAIGESNPRLVDLKPFIDGSIEPGEYIALPNPAWNEQVPWKQAEEADPNWAYIDRPLLQRDIFESLDAGTGGATALMGSGGTGKSTMLRWIARTDQRARGIDSAIYIDCRGKHPRQIQERLRDQLGIDTPPAEDVPAFARSIAGRSLRIVLDEVGGSPLMDSFVRTLVDVGGARIVIAPSVRGGVRGDRINLTDDRYLAESRHAQVELARKVLSGANLSDDGDFIHSLVDAAGNSFLTVYMLASIGEMELPAVSRAGTGVANALADVLVRGVLDRLEVDGLHPGDFQGRVREALLALAVAEGDGMPSAALWADVAEVPALVRKPFLRQRLIESIGSHLETVRSTGPEGVPVSSWRLQATAIVAAFSSRAERMHSTFASRLLRELRLPPVDRDSRIASYAYAHLAEHLRRARRLGELTKIPSIMASLDRVSLIQSLALDSSSVARALQTIIRANGEGDLLSALALLGGGFNLAALAELSREQAGISISAEWTDAPPNCQVFAADGNLAVGSEGPAASLGGSVSSAWLPIAISGHGILSFCTEGGSRAWMSTHDGIVSYASFGFGGLAVPTNMFKMPGVVHALFVRNGVLTASSASHVVCVAVDGAEKAEVLPYPAVVGAVAFNPAEVAVVTSTGLIWRRNGHDFHRAIPQGHRTFLAMDAAGEWLFASTEDGSVWAWERAKHQRAIPIVSGGGATHFSALEAGDRVHVAVAMADRSIKVFEVSEAPRLQWSFEFPLDVSSIALLGQSECGISTDHGTLRIKYAGSRTEEGI